MGILNIPTSKDIYIEINGIKVAVIESYRANSEKNLSLIEEFGSSVPVCAINGTVTHRLELKRIYFIAPNKNTVDFHSLRNFSIVIVKPDKRIIYSGCEWSEINESVNLNEPCIEAMIVTALERTEI